MRYPHLIEQIYHRPLFMTGPAWLSVHHAFQGALSRRMGATPAAADSKEDETEQEIMERMDRTGVKLSDMVNPRQPLAIADGIARIEIKGLVARGLSNVERVCGATGFEQIESDFASALAQGARGILLSEDSGGGTVNGTPETAHLVAEVSKSIPVVVHTSGMIGSAAYYIAAGASAIIASRSAMVGSIGTIIPWIDFSAEMRQAGLVGDPITNAEGDLKGAGWVTGSLTAAQRAEYQAQAQAMFEDFKGHVLAHREVPADAMRGQLLYGKGMLDAHLIDDFGSEEDALELLRSMVG